MQKNDSLVLCWHCCGGLGWQLIGGVNISNASPEYLHPERVINGSCNYPPGDPTQSYKLHVASGQGRFNKIATQSYKLHVASGQGRFNKIATQSYKLHVASGQGRFNKIATQSYKLHVASGQGRFNKIATQSYKLHVASGQGRFNKIAPDGKWTKTPLACRKSNAIFSLCVTRPLRYLSILFLNIFTLLPVDRRVEGLRSAVKRKGSF